MDRFKAIADHFNNSTSEDVNIAIGLRPSGIIHLGNMATLAAAGLLAREIGPTRANVILTICDLDLPDRSDWNAKKNEYVKYFDSLKDSNGNNLLSSATSKIKGFVSKLEDRLDVGFEVINLSDVQRHPGYREGLRRVLDKPGMIKYLFPNSPDDKHVPIHPLCKECKTSNFKAPIYDSGKIYTSCANPGCEEEGNEVEVDINDTSVDLAAHYFIDPIRDANVPPFANAHVFGGDYSEKHYGSGDHKVVKVRKVMKASLPPNGSERVPLFYVGPLFYARDGSKMSKSKHNGITMDELRAAFDDSEDSYVDRVLGLTSSLIDHGFNHVDFKIWDSILFKSPRQLDFN